MKKFVLDIINKIFELQDKFLKNKYAKQSKMLGYSAGGMSKVKLTSGASLSISSELTLNKQKVEEEVRKLALENYGHFENLFIYAGDYGAKLYILPHADKFLRIIKESKGLILPKKGLNALYLNLVFRRKISLKTDVMFVFDKESINPYEALYNFYKWYSYNMDMPGFKDEDVMKVKGMFETEEDPDFKTLRYEEILSLKDAIERDREAMSFVVGFMKTMQGSKNAFDVMKEGDKGANI